MAELDVDRYTFFTSSLTIFVAGMFLELILITRFLAYLAHIFPILNPFRGPPAVAMQFNRASTITQMNDITLVHTPLYFTVRNTSLNVYTYKQYLLAFIYHCILQSEKTAD